MRTSAAHHSWARAKNYAGTEWEVGDGIGSEIEFARISCGWEGRWMGRMGRAGLDYTMWHQGQTEPGPMGREKIGRVRNAVDQGEVPGAGWRYLTQESRVSRRKTASEYIPAPVSAPMRRRRPQFARAWLEAPWLLLVSECSVRASQDLSHPDHRWPIQGVDDPGYEVYQVYAASLATRS